MSKEATHIGRRSWWNGKVRTLCGLTLDQAKSAWFGPSCSACKRAKREGRRV